MEYKEYKIVDLFKVNSSKKIFHANAVNVFENQVGNTYPYIVRMTTNNGKKGYIEAKLNELNPSNTLSFAQDTFTVFYQEKEYVTGNKIKILVPRERFNYRIAIYIIAALNKTLVNYSWGTGSNVNFIENIKFYMPIDKNNLIDYNFIERYISELEEERISELTAYLKVSGLDNYELSKEEKSILSKDISKKSFKLGKLFFATTGDVDLQQKDINGKGEYFINSGIENSGIKGKTDKQAKIFSRNTITIDFWGNAYYRPFQYKMATHNHVFSLSSDIIKNEKVGLYLVAQMSYLRKLYSYNNMGTWNKMKELEIHLPVLDNNSPDYNYMELYISALEKISVKNIVEWKDKVIAETKDIIK